MQNLGATVNSDPGRSAIDRRAVTAAAQLLMSAIWLEHRVRRVSTRLTMSSSQQASNVSVVRPSVAHRSGSGLLAPDSRSD
jgi:hypothetical protein